MDDGHPAGRSDLAGDEEFLLTPAPLRLFNAWSDEPWINEGAAVRVSLVCFGAVGWVERTRETRQTPAADAGFPLRCNPAYPNILNGQPVAVIHADLTGQPLDGDGEAVDLTMAVRLAENLGTCFMGASKKAPFDIPGELARSWLNLPNPHQHGNAEVLRPLWNGLDLTRRPRDIWIIDFGTDMSEAESALYERPFEYVVQHVKPVATKNADAAVARHWWRHARPRVEMRAALLPVSRYIVTPHVSKHRLFVWLDSAVLSDQMLLVTARADDTTFGILHSRFHELWSLRMGTSLEDRPRYTPTTTFETFPFPEGCTPRDTRPPDPDEDFVIIPTMDWDPDRREFIPIPPTYLTPPIREPGAPPVRHWHAIAQAAAELNRLREAWLNPPDWVDWVITPQEEQAGFPRRPVAKPGHEADLKKRTLTNLYNARPAWLAMAHEKLDQAVAAAYSWDDYTPDMPDEEILRRLLALNRARAES